MITRFAPSPTGFLHLGHAYAAWVASQWGETMLLRHEDIDPQLSRPEYAQRIEDDLDWLGIDFRRPALRQTDNTVLHQQALAHLIEQGYAYPCFCSRGDIRRATRAPHVPEGVYPGTCRTMGWQERVQRMKSATYAYRLDMARALATVGEVTFSDQRFGECNNSAQAIGDAVIARKDGGMSYHLAVVVDDAAQQIDLVTRGEDLLPITPLHVVLQRLLNLPTPRYLHHHLVRDDQGVRLAKRDDARSLKHYREAGYTPEQVFALLPDASVDMPDG